MNWLKKIGYGLAVAAGVTCTSSVSLAQTPLEDANAAIATEAANVQALAVSASTSLASNAVTIATTALVLLVILSVLGFIWSMMKGRSVRC